MFTILRTCLIAMLGRFVWQPIATAPRDGTVVDLWHKNQFRITETWWVSDDKCWSAVFDDSDVTHWAPVISPGGMMRLAKDEEA